MNINSRPCHRRVMWPLNGKWHVVYCQYWIDDHPMSADGTEPMHGDHNWAPLCTESDAVLFDRQYGLMFP